MIDLNKIDSWAKQIEALIPSGFKIQESAFRDKIRQLLLYFVQEIQLVSREEFEIQSNVLKRTREKLDTLEKTIAALNEKN